MNNIKIGEGSIFMFEGTGKAKRMGAIVLDEH